MKEAISAARAELMRLREGNSPHVATAPAAPIAAASPAKQPPPAPPARKPNPRPPAHYLAGPREEWRDHVSPSGFIAPGAGRGDWWGPI
jgi:hypothetical protein